MRTYIISFLIAILVTFVTTPLVRRLAVRFGAVDRPGGRRVNVETVSRLGGIAILAGFLTPLVSLFFTDNYVARIFHDELIQSVGLLVGALAMAGLGVVDDLKSIRALHKFLFQVTVAIFAYGVGFRIDAINLPLVGPLEMGVFALPVTVLWIVGIVNAVNLIDGLDGLAAGVAFLACLVNFVVGTQFSEVVIVSLLAAALGGALLGFLIHNTNPATIFMGDSGSLFIGFVLATLSLGGSAAKATTAVSLLVPILAMGLPITDTLCAIIRRYLERRPLFSADTGHIHHRLLQLGLTQRRAVLILYGTSLVFTAAAILVYLGRAWQIALALGVSSLVIVGLVRGVKLFQPISVHIDERPTICAECARRFRYSVPEYLKNIDEANDLVSLMNSILLFCKNAHIEKFKCQSTGLDGFGAWTWNGGRNDSDLPSNPGAINSSSNFVFSLENGISGTVEFHWFSESEKLSPAAEIMLQIVVDAFERRLKHITLSSSSDRDSDHSEKRDFHSQCTQMSE